MQEVIAPAILPTARELVQRHRDAGDLCCIVAATNGVGTAPIGKALGFEHLLCIELGTEGGDPLARFTGASVGIPTFREGQNHAHRELAGPARSLFAGLSAKLVL